MVKKYESFKELEQDINLILERMDRTEYQVFRPAFEDFCRANQLLKQAKDLAATASERYDWKE